VRTHLYEIRTGRWTLDGVLLGVGHSGTDDGDGILEPGEGLNDPSAVALKGVGPLPPGIYEIGDPVDSPTTGPYSLRLKPLQPNVMYGRSAFVIHGGGPTASKGCIVLPRSARIAIHESGVERLVVVAEVSR
jgi:hypothetical protein